MKFRYIIPFVFVVLSLSLNAQLPQAFSFQGMAMDSDGNLVSNTNILLEVSILKDGTTGEVVYTEVENVLTSDLGHFNLEIGRGEATLGEFDQIDWSSGDHFASIGMDITGGMNFNTIGVVELVSVPYAFLALESGTGIIGPQGPAGPQGPQGPPGPQGAKGPAGSNTGAPIAGPPGPQGAQGPQGPAGPPGDNGSDVGPKGLTGPRGLPGIDYTGPPGGPGPEGPPGPRGAQGPQGIDGGVGPPGDPGPQGEPGPPGPKGIGGGIPGPKGITGPPGDDQGAPGPQGPTGPVGQLGFPGAQGPSGPAGPAGRNGSNGKDEPNGIVNMPMLSTPPTTPGLGYYLDNGDNTSNGLPGFRYWNGSTWID